MERRVAQLVLSGVFVAAGSLVSGLVLWMAAAPRGEGLMNAGLLVLMAIPVLRVVLSILEYARARDWAFAAAAAAVLAILLLSILYSRSV